MRSVGLLVLGLLFAGSVAASPPLPSEASKTIAPPTYEIAGGKATVTLLSRGKSYMGILTGKPGLKVPVHTHAGSIEMLYVLEGGGFMTLDGKRSAVKAGMAIQVPAGVTHSFEIPADWTGKDFKAVQVYTPAGPEERFTRGKLISGAK